MKNVYIGLGSNQGDKIRNLHDALRSMRSIIGINIKKISSLYISEPWGYLEQPDFINQVIEIETEISARELLHNLQNIEIKMGRQRIKKWGPRVIDLDILLYGDEEINTSELIIPHPYMRERLFVLLPLQEINSELVFPGDGAKIKEVLIRAEVREGNHKIERIQGSPADTL
ncbi:MAG: 2-amino-4-hydroxy-6-hydroxymethyldihydropteridine diphosphokinase [Syntrophomonadaceae bacterium]|nr:2-amino-4-hydroxy-6-hydroxymethyldihydropteridine diphosphokinase [Syntrophomonadaceae bacterium]